MTRTKSRPTSKGKTKSATKAKAKTARATAHKKVAAAVSRKLTVVEPSPTAFSAKAKAATKSATKAKAKGKLHGRPVAVPATPSPADLAGRPTGTYQQHELLADLPSLLHTERELTEVIRRGQQADKQRKAVRLDIEGLMAAEGIAFKEPVTCGPYKVTRQEVAGRSFLSEAKLLAAGVTAETIAACYEQADGYTMIDVRAIKAGAADVADIADAGTEGSEVEGVKVLTA